MLLLQVHWQKGIKYELQDTEKEIKLNPVWNTLKFSGTLWVDGIVFCV